jgi:RNA polymerase sigma factor (sigma-70 family)
MRDSSDMELVRDYARLNSEAAFAELVQRHINLAYSAALRHVGNAAHAEEITQAVFIILARKAASLRPDCILEGWLHETTRLTALSFLRGERRRQFREQEAYMLSTLQETNDASTWNQLAPMLDEAVSRLAKKDRDAVMLRFFKDKNLREVAAALNVNEAAAQRRVLRAVEKLRRFFTNRGVALSSVAIAGAISANSIQAAPVALAKSVTAVAIVKGAAAGISTLALVKGTMKMMVWAKMKFAAVLGAGLLLAGSAVTVAIVDKSANSDQPDPVALLKNVAAAREKIKSGEMEFVVARHDFKYAIQTNYSLLKVVFDGEKRRFEQLQRETAIVSMSPDAGKIVEAKRIELGGDNDALAQLGLIELQDAHYRTIYDGKSLTQLDPRLDTNIRDSKDGSAEYVFDPRTLGLSDALFPDDTIENCLAYQTAQSVSLIGKENVDGISAWHVKVQVTDDWRYEFWIDANRPTHVVKQEAPNRGGTVLSKFDEQNPDDPIPLEINIVDDHFGSDPRPWERRMIRRNTRYNVPIDPKAWTLAGLGMPVGTPVNDNRIMRRIGYWTGSNLSENFPRNAPARTDKVASIMEYNPESLAKAKIDASFVDERKIVLWRLEIGVGLLALIFVVALAIKRLRAKFVKQMLIVEKVK